MKWSSFKYLVKQGWHSMVANRLMTLASIGVLVACLMITGVAALLSVNVTSYVDYLETLNEIVFFIDDAAPAETVEALKTQIPADGNVAACEYVPKAAAVEEMREYLGDYGDIMNDYAGEGNTENPLPASFRVSVTDVADLAPTVERIKAMGAYTATAEDGTASDANVFYKVNSPSELSSTLVNLKRIVNYIGWGLVAVLGVVSVVVISNTIRLTVFARRKEISIRRKETQRDELRACLLPGAIRYDRDRVQSTPTDKMADVIVRVDELDREIEQLRREKASLVIEISDAIETLEDDNEKTVLTEFYIARAPMTEVADAINYSVRRAYHFRKMGVTHLGEVLG